MKPLHQCGSDGRDNEGVSILARPERRALQKIPRTRTTNPLCVVMIHLLEFSNHSLIGKIACYNEIVIKLGWDIVVLALKTPG